MSKNKKERGITIPNKQQFIDTNEIFNRPISSNETNLIVLIGAYIQAHNDIDTSTIYQNSVDIQKYIDINSLVQRTMLNKYFIETLMIYRNINDNVNVNPLIPYLRNDGSQEDWTDLMREYVIPYICNNKVLVSVHNHALKLQEAMTNAS